MRPALFALAAALIPAAAAAQQPPDTPADWLRRPTADDLLAVWPTKALEKGLGGRVVLSCVVTAQGTLRQCEVAEEEPKGAGFGAAALVLTQQFAMKPARRNGQPVESTVRIPLNFPKPDKATGSHIQPSTDTPFKGDRVVAGLRWLEAPSYAEVMAAYPEKAQAEKASGFVTLDCRVTEEGRLNGCDTAREEPRGMGFGRAARALVGRFRAQTTLANGETLGRVRTHLAFAFRAEALDNPTPVIGRPNWVALPSIQDLSSVLPEAARKAGVFKARVVMNCTVAAGGALEACAAESEEPAGLGYGAAAVAVSKSFRLGMWSEEGLPTVGGRVRVPIRFDLEEVAKPAEAAAKP